MNMKLIHVLITIFVIVTLVCAKKRKFEGDFEFVDESDQTTIQKPIQDKSAKQWIRDSSSDLCRPLNCKKKEICLLENEYTAVCVSKKELHRKRDEISTPKSSPKRYRDNNKKTNSDNNINNNNINNNINNNNNNNNNEQRNDVQEKNESQDFEIEDDVFYDSESSEPDENVCKPCPVIKPTFLCGSDNHTYSSMCRLDYHNCLHTSGVKVACTGFCPCKENTEATNKQQQQQQHVQTDRNSNFYLKRKLKKEKDVEDNNGKEHQSDKHKVRGYNEVLDKPNTNTKYSKFTGSSNQISTKNPQCKPQQIVAIGNRLLDWFSVIMADSKKKKQHIQKTKAHFPAACKTEAKWMFCHMDLNTDGSLSAQELYDLEHDQNEKCIKPFIDSCDLDQDNVIIPREWCRCFEKTDRPCAAVRRRIGTDLLAYAPDCDAQGFYKPTQCHNSVGVCWCVDKHGVEFANTRTRSKPNCDDVLTNAASNIPSDDEDDETDDDDDSSEGSADNLLVF